MIGIGNLLYLSLSVIGPCNYCASTSMILCWAGMEIGFIATIPLLSGYASTYSLSKESVLKYFCIQAFSSAIIFLGGVILYETYSEYWSMWLALAGLMIKLGVWPGHFWVPGVASGISEFPLFIMLVVLKVAPIALLINIADFMELGMHLVVLGVITATTGALMGLNSAQFNQMLACSSITHMGWMCVGILLGGIWVYFLCYSVALGFLLYFKCRGNTQMAALVLLSFSGLPPFLMFVGKWVLLSMMVTTSVHLVVILSLLISAFLSLSFYLMFSYGCYLDSSSQPVWWLLRLAGSF
uniref:NADH-ubiquinone oxidoreductase chain 2 n=1 Tax=Pupa strigosa TaxID=96460 RepID=Q9T9F6_9GAST|nr:NADH dehydrogenase subunit 2 [Pupa strigosa]BAA89027.1 ND2 [Pupa strigosa]